MRDYLFVTVANDEYVPGLLIAIYSLQKNLQLWNDCDLKIYYNNRLAPLSQQSIKSLKLIEPKIQFVHCDISLNYIKKFQSIKNFQQTYLIFEAFNESCYEKVIGFDSDIICQIDFSELLKMPSEGFMAVTELEPHPNFFKTNRFVRKIFNKSMLDSDELLLSSIEKFLVWARNLKIILNTCIRSILRKPRKILVLPNSINSGFFVICKDLLERKLTNKLYEESIQFIEESDERIQLIADQPIINKVIVNGGYKFTPLGFSMNAYGGIYRHCPESTYQNVRIFHFAGTLKPWQKPQSDKEKNIQKLYPFKQWYQLEKELHQKEFSYK